MTKSFTFRDQSTHQLPNFSFNINSNVFLSTAAFLRDRKWTHFTPLHWMSLPVLAEIQTFHYAVTRPWRGQSKPLYSMTWKIGHFENIAKYVCVILTSQLPQRQVIPSQSFIFQAFVLMKHQHWKNRLRINVGESNTGQRPIWQQVIVSLADMQD